MPKFIHTVDAASPDGRILQLQPQIVQDIPDIPIPKVKVRIMSKILFINGLNNFSELKSFGKQYIILEMNVFVQIIFKFFELRQADPECSTGSWWNSIMMSKVADLKH